MKKYFSSIAVAVSLLITSCSDVKNNNNNSETQGFEHQGGQEAVVDDESQKDVVKVAAGSPDHTTLVAAVKQAELITSLSNAGPFTVFAPVNSAFDKIDKSTLDALMTDEKKTDLQNILQYHVAVAALKAEYFRDGQSLGMVNGDNVTVNIVDGKIRLNNTATIIASIPASNGIVHVIDAVLLPPAK